MSATLEEYPPFITAEFTQEVVPGPVKIPGLKAGDILIALNYTGRDDGHALQGHGWFEGIVTVDDEFQQRAGTTAPADFHALFVRLPSKGYSGGARPVEPEEEHHEFVPAPVEPSDPIPLPAVEHYDEQPIERETPYFPAYAPASDEHLSEGEPK